MQILSDRAPSEIITHIKALLLITGEEKDSLLLALLEDAYAYAVAYTGVSTIPSAILSKMVCEDFSRGSSGAIKKSRGSASEEYPNGYSSATLALLSANRKIKVL
ncbi:MAG: phage head-tail connector protein [Clostridia bacterium]|nr:phage head-tail connector protein [Clostridia bacterium]MBR2296502.1 phage head-tail connector protein [Clostridia bacterium]